MRRHFFYRCPKCERIFTRKALPFGPAAKVPCGSCGHLAPRYHPGKEKS